DAQLIQVVGVLREADDLERVGRVDGHLHVDLAGEAVVAGVDVGAGAQGLRAEKVQHGRGQRAIFEGFELESVMPVPADTTRRECGRAKQLEGKWDHQNSLLKDNGWEEPEVPPCGSERGITPICRQGGTRRARLRKNAPLFVGARSITSSELED